ncbi:winged helix-turn-helix transcriptional regulator [Roseateles sp. NT4]|uniref:winged helix-turn-helix transcriptional regulator n=1 Tax=Roseateles sp. NT4 TaxID=3453715 RepID=UPI003EEA6D18
MNEDVEKFPPRYPARRLLALVGDKWTPVVLYSLSEHVKRFSEIRREIPDISKKMLAQVLRTLERGGVVERTVLPVIPPGTQYCLTDLGRKLHEPVALLCGWASHNEEILDFVHARLRSCK